MEKIPSPVTYISIYCSNYFNFFHFCDQFVSGSAFCFVYIIVASRTKNGIENCINDHDLNQFRAEIVRVCLHRTTLRLESLNGKDDIIDSAHIVMRFREQFCFSQKGVHFMLEQLEERENEMHQLLQLANAYE